MSNLQETLPAMHNDPSAIPHALRQLRQTRPPRSGVLTVYLDTSIQRVEGKAYYLALRDGLRGLEDELAKSGRRSRRAFDQAAARAEEYVSEQLAPQHPGLALFAAERPEYLLAVPLPRRPAEDFAWGAGPLLAPLAAAIDDFERIAVAVVDSRRSRLFTIFLGQLEAGEEFESDVPGKQATGLWGGVTRAPGTGAAGGRAPRGGGMAAARFARHQEDHVLRHLRHTTRALMDLLRDRPFDRLLLAGPQDAVVMLQDELPRPLRDRFSGTLALAATASEAETLEAALEEARALEREGEARQVRELIEAETTPRAALGLDATLAALHQRRVHQLFLVRGLTSMGSVCPACGRLVAGPGPCPECGTATVPVLDLGDRALALALEQGARVEIVSGEAADLLRVHGGMGAFTRY